MISNLIRKFIMPSFTGFMALVVLSMVMPRTGYADSRKVNIGYHPAMCLAAIYVAKDKNLFNRSGIGAAGMARIIKSRISYSRTPPWRGCPALVALKAGQGALNLTCRGD